MTSPWVQALARKSLRVFLLLVLALLVLVALYTWLTLSWSYSAGERVGYVQKISHKGWLCKTWEGDLAMVNMPGQPAEKFLFTVRDEAVVARINALAGQRVTLTYAQHVGVPTSCFGDTAYFVSDVREVPGTLLTQPVLVTPAASVPATGK